MKTRLMVAIVVCALSTIACANEEQSAGEERVIARVGAKVIVYEEIRCDARFEEPPAEPRCHSFEQRKLDALMASELIQAAARLHGISVSDQEALAAAGAAAVPSDRQVEDVAARFKAMAAAALRVHNGAPADAVFATDLAPKGITRQEFDAAYSRWSREEAEKALTLDYIAEARRQVVAQQRTLLLLRRLNEIVATRASERRLPPEEASRQLWREVIEKTGSVVVDKRYSFPDMERF
jgi:hypothetical protein